MEGAWENSTQPKAKPPPGIETRSFHSAAQMVAELKRWYEMSSNLNIVMTLFFQKIDTEIRKEVDEAVKFSKADKEIPIPELAADVYYNPLEMKIRGVSPLSSYTHQKINTPFNADWFIEAQTLVFWGDVQL